jgi:hypothetical protein
VGLLGACLGCGVFVSWQRAVFDALFDEVVQGVVVAHEANV